jgi:Flp pilus assembly protein TadG
MRALIDRFVRDRRGNYAMMTAFLILPLVLGTGTALDYANLSRKQKELQSAVDAAVLAITREGAEITDKQAEDIAWQFLGGNVSLDIDSLKVKRTGTKVQLEVKSDALLAFGGVLGYDRWPLHAKAGADIAYVKYEIGLVLDTTGSMGQGGKLQSMKDAVTGMIDSMSAQMKDKEDLKYAIVPFSNFVNVGANYGPEFKKNGKIKPGTGADWLDLKGDADIPQLELKTGLSRFELLHHLKQDWTGCVETRVRSGGIDYDVLDIAPNPTKPETLFVPAFSIDEPEGYANSYIVSNIDPLDNSVLGKLKKLLKYGIGAILAPLIPSLEWDTPNTDYSRGRGPNNSCLSQPIMPLNNDYSAIKKKVNSLKANGNTNIGEGVAWGTRVLSSQAPFTEGSKPGKNDVLKIMIVLTDGANVFGVANGRNNVLGSSYTSQGYLVDGRLGVTSGTDSSTNALMNARTLAACDAAKKAGMEVYTIRLEEPDVKTGYMLRDCASSSEHFFDVPNKSMLDDAFQKIGTKIVRIRITS